MTSVEDSKAVSKPRTPARLWRRVLAASIDALALLIVSGASSETIARALAAGGALVLVEGVTGWSIGKLSLGLRIRTSEGGPPAPARLLGRTLAKNLGYVLGTLTIVAKVDGLTLIAPIATLLVFLGCFLVLGSRRHALHDRLVATSVFAGRWTDNLLPWVKGQRVGVAADP